MAYLNAHGNQLNGAAMLADNDEDDEMEGEEDEVSKAEHICHGASLTRAIIEQSSPFATDSTTPHPVATPR